MTSVQQRINHCNCKHLHFCVHPFIFAAGAPKPHAVLISLQWSRSHPHPATICSGAVANENPAPLPKCHVSVPPRFNSLSNFVYVSAVRRIETEFTVAKDSNLNRSLQAEVLFAIIQAHQSYHSKSHLNSDGA